MLAKAKHIIGSRWFIAIACLLLGAFLFAGARVIAYTVPETHYHANFALYINGEQETFKGAQYYTEVQMCSLKAVMTPTGRAHMHDDVNNVVHVEDRAVTWGHFFTNIGWTLGPDFIVNPDNVLYGQNGDSELHLVLNGQDYTGLGGLNNTVIKDKDVLLLSYGNQTIEQIQQEYKSIPHTAASYDSKKDPASCSGNQAIPIKDRFTHILR